MSDEVIKHAYYITAFAFGIIYYMKIKKTDSAAEAAKSVLSE